MTNANAPTKKVENNIENGLTVDLGNGTILCANANEEYGTMVLDPTTGEEIYGFGGGGYSITSHAGLMPAFYTRNLYTLQELANAMRDHADLRTWKTA